MMSAPPKPRPRATQREGCLLNLLFFAVLILIMLFGVSEIAGNAALVWMASE